VMECVVNQKFNHNWEAYFVGDNCSDFQKLLDNGSFDVYIEQAKQKGNRIIVHNLDQHYGGWGYEARNHVYNNAVGEYFMFMDNDDVISENHFQTYFDGINGTDLDFAYYDTWIESKNIKRVSDILFGTIGHHEIIVKTEFLKRMPKQEGKYHDDWTLIENMVRNTNKYKKIRFNEPTYIVKGIDNVRQDVID
jgi:glycosyltransferase involved in cell wall biosynthesis